jgi:gluconate kinase
MIIHLNGWPGVGKKTIGTALSNRLAARFIHNHVLHDVAIVCAGLQGAHRWELYEEVRYAAYKILARHPRSEVFVMTNALCNGAPREEQAWKHVVDLAMARKVPLVPVVLEASASELRRRVQSPERVGQKLSDAAVLTEMMAGNSLQRPDVAELIALDVSDLTAQEAADSIIGRLDSLRGNLQPASYKHLQLLK